MKLILVLILTMAITTAATAQNTAIGYIEKYKETAVGYMKEYGLPASVILAISMHESANGNSKIARYLNNHFGIKGKNSSTEIRSAYRGYDSVSESYQDFIGALKRNAKFRSLFGKYSASDYYNWVMGIQQGGYAASKVWGSQVLAIIKKYRLYELDGAAPSVLTESSGSPEQEVITTYVVKAGDTLSAIARRFGTTVSNIMSTNLLKSSKLSIGQRLTLE